MIIQKSRFTPGLKNGEGVAFQIGDIVDYRMRDGTELKITIDSELMTHSGYRGYEAIFSDNGERAFAPAIGIYNWDGKVA